MFGRFEFRAVLLSAVAAVIFPASAAAQLDEDEFPPGMLARYTAGGKTVERIEPDVAFDWGSSAPDVRLPAGPFTARWQSQLLVRHAGTYRFHVYLAGRATVEVDGKPVLAASGEGQRPQVGPAWFSSKEFPLNFGEKSLTVSYSKTGKAARIGLYWSSDAFPLEPVPGHLLFREESRPDLSLIERGRVAFDAHRCNRCHVRQNDPPAPAAPALTQVGVGMTAERLVEAIRQTGESSRHRRMPSFSFTEIEAQAVAAFLFSRSKPARLRSFTSPARSASKGEQTAKEVRQGELLVRSVGCLACHTVGDHGTAGDYGGGDLTAVGAKRSADWLANWLTDPARLNPDHRMPVFKLTGSERRALVAYLRTGLSESGSNGDAAEKRPKTDNPARTASKQQIDEGRRLVEAARCAACHRIDGVKADLTRIPDLSKPPADWSRSCLSENADPERRRPSYKKIDGEALRAFVNSRSGALSPPSAYLTAERVLERRQCLQCHPRGRSKGIVAVAGRIALSDPDLRGKSESLIPPTLNAIGDKLLDEALSAAVAGEQKQIRMTWLTVRMPRFRHADEEKQAVVSYLIAHDRIPPATPGLPPNGTGLSESGSRADPTDPNTLVAGHTLVGPKGFSCIACHQVGSFVPRNVASGTRGSDLMRLGERMRQEYYVRWTRSPARIVPGMEMPSYLKGVPAVLDGNINRQLAATWDALNDPKFTPPTDPSSVEQFLVVGAGEPARIVRDVFTNSAANGGGYVARSFAIGLNNGHNVLFDLDRFAVRQWTFGDFARQRTQGKSWYWDMAGLPVVSGFEPVPGIALEEIPQADRNDDRPASGGRKPPVSTAILPKMQHGTGGRLLDYRSAPETRDHPSGGARRGTVSNGVRLRYRVNFEIAGRVRPVVVTEVIRPVPGGSAAGRGGWQRSIAVADVPDGYRVLISWPIFEQGQGLGQPRIEPDSESPAPRGTANSQTDKTRFGKLCHFTRLKMDGAGKAVGTLTYRCNLKPEPGRLNLKPADPLQVEQVTTVPGFDGVRLPIPRSIMPTAMTFTAGGKLAFTSLKGDVFIADDADGDGVEDRLTLFEEGLAAPFGIIADGPDLIVAHKPELLRLRDTDGDGRADVREVVASGWGYNDNYHDWTCGIVRDAGGNLYVGLGSDYAQNSRPRENARWRGDVLRIAPDGEVTSVGHSFRYPVGLAINADGDIFVSDNQGVQNTFNEINHLIAGRYYGVPSRYEANPDAPATPPAIQVPHPWSRSVNGLFFLPVQKHRNLPAQKPGLSEGSGFSPLAGDGVGCEYDSRFLVRFTLQKVGGAMQGAVYYFSRPNAGIGDRNFVGPLCGTVSPGGDIYIGSIYDSGWLGGRNTGAITRLRPNGKLPNGIRELRATPDGFQIEFIREIDRTAAAKTDSYSISGYTRVWQGSYATPDSGRHRVAVESVRVSEDGRTVHLKVDRLREGYVYEVSAGRIGDDAKTPLWPATGHYTMHRIPSDEKAARSGR